jgi:hypothetical protein
VPNGDIDQGGFFIAKPHIETSQNRLPKRNAQPTTVTILKVVGQTRDELIIDDERAARASSPHRPPLERVRLPLRAEGLARQPASGLG